MELMASESSTAFFLSMQQVSTQKYRSPSAAACLAQMYLAVASLALARAGFYILEGDLFAIRTPSVRKYCVGGDVAANEFAQDRLAIGLSFQESPRETFD